MASSSADSSLSLIRPTGLSHRMPSPRSPGPTRTPLDGSPHQPQGAPRPLPEGPRQTLAGRGGCRITPGPDNPQGLPIGLGGAGRALGVVEKNSESAPVA